MSKHSWNLCVHFSPAILGTNSRSTTLRMRREIHVMLAQNIICTMSVDRSQIWWRWGYRLFSHPPGNVHTNNRHHRCLCRSEFRVAVVWIPSPYGIGLTRHGVFNKREKMGPGFWADEHLTLDGTMKKMRELRSTIAFVDQRWLWELRSVLGGAQLRICKCKLVVAAAVVVIVAVGNGGGGGIAGTWYGRGGKGAM